MWTTDGTIYTVPTLQPNVDVTLTTAKNQYWRETSLTNEEV
jgi:hypothetical protein